LNPCLDRFGIQQIVSPSKAVVVGTRLHNQVSSLSWAQRPAGA
jgi:hypothetical protein